MLHHGKLGQHFCVEHFDHALICCQYSVPIMITARPRQTLLIFAHPSLMPEMSYKVGLCSQNAPFLTSKMKPMAEKYMFCDRCCSTKFRLAMRSGLGAPWREPSVGNVAPIRVGGQYCAEPKIYGKKEWSSSPQTPWDPAGSRVYVRIRSRISSRYLWTY